MMRNHLFNKQGMGPEKILGHQIVLSGAKLDHFYIKLEQFLKLIVEELFTLKNDKSVPKNLND